MMMMMVITMMMVMMMITNDDDGDDDYLNDVVPDHALPLLLGPRRGVVNGLSNGAANRAAGGHRCLYWKCARQQQQQHWKCARQQQQHKSHQLHTTIIDQQYLHIHIYTIKENRPLELR